MEQSSKLLVPAISRVFLTMERVCWVHWGLFKYAALLRRNQASSNVWPGLTCCPESGNLPVVAADHFPHDVVFIGKVVEHVTGKSFQTGLEPGQSSMVKDLAARTTSRVVSLKIMGMPWARKREDKG